MEVLDRHSRPDRPIEIEKISELCNHGITLEQSRILGILFRVIDKLNLEKNHKSRIFLRTLGLYSFDDPTESPRFLHGKPRILRCYFQRSDIVEKTWPIWKNEIEEALMEVNISEFDSVANASVIHVRRGDTLSLMSTHGLLTSTYFKGIQNSELKTYLSTDDKNIPTAFRDLASVEAILNPENSTTWQCLKLFCNAKEFYGSNSTLSWWGSYLRKTSRVGISILPFPWTKIPLGYESALHTDQVKFKNSEFENE